MSMAPLADDKAEPAARGTPGHAARGGGMNKGCKAYAVELSAYFDGELEPGQVKRVEAHLADCAACRETLARLSKLRKALHALARPPRQRRSVLADLQARLAEEDADSDDDAPQRDRPLC